MSSIPPFRPAGYSIGPVAFWIVILFTAAAAGAYLTFGSYVVDQFQ